MIPVSLPAAFVDQLVQVQVADDKSAVASPSLESVEHATFVSASETDPPTVTESHAVAVSLGGDGRASASGTVHLYVVLALLLAVTGLIVGVVL